MKTTLTIIALVCAATLTYLAGATLTYFAGAFSNDTIEWVKGKAITHYNTGGFKIVSYQGYNIFPFGYCLWYTTIKDGIHYQSCLIRWNDEVHEYKLRSIDAIRGK